jgi:hypothetical protein
MESRPTMDMVALDLALVVQRSAGRLGPLRRELVELREKRLDAVTAAVAELSEFARGEHAPGALRAVQRRIDRGELSWQRVALGEGDVLRDLLGERLARLPEAFGEACALTEDGLDPEEAARRSRVSLAGETDSEAAAGSGLRSAR